LLKQNELKGIPLLKIPDAEYEEESDGKMKFEDLNESNASGLDGLGYSARK
jgi:hypothetical protein